MVKTYEIVTYVELHTKTSVFCICIYVRVGVSVCVLCFVHILNRYRSRYRYRNRFAHTFIHKYVAAGVSYGKSRVKCKGLVKLVQIAHILV